MDAFIVVFALVFIVGFVVRVIYRATMQTRCLDCRTQVHRSAKVCAACGARLSSAA